MWGGGGGQVALLTVHKVRKKAMLPCSFRPGFCCPLLPSFLPGFYSPVWLWFTVHRVGNWTQITLFSSSTLQFGCGLLCTMSETGSRLPCLLVILSSLAVVYCEPCRKLDPDYPGSSLSFESLVGFFLHVLFLSTPPPPPPCLHVNTVRLWGKGGGGAGESGRGESSRSFISRPLARYKKEGEGGP